MRGPRDDSKELRLQVFSPCLDAEEILRFYCEVRNLRFRIFFRNAFGIRWKISQGVLDISEQEYKAFLRKAFPCILDLARKKQHERE